MKVYLDDDDVPTSRWLWDLLFPFASQRGPDLCQTKTFTFATRSCHHKRLMLMRGRSSEHVVKSMSVIDSDIRDKEDRP